METKADAPIVFSTDLKPTTQPLPTGSATGSVLERQDGSQAANERLTIIAAINLKKWSSNQIFFLSSILSISFTKSTGEREL